MSNHKDLRDRLYREMLDSQRAWSSGEIARNTLRIVSDTSRADALVGAILAGDSRFRREGPAWRACATVSPRLDMLPFVLIDAPPPSRPTLATPLYFQTFDAERAACGEIVEVLPDGAALERVSPWLVTRVGVSLSAPAVRRGLHLLERLHALPTTSDRLIDLAAVLRSHGEQIPEQLARGSSASAEERLHAGRGSLQFVLEHHGGESFESLERRIETTLAGEPVDFSRFGFGPDRLNEIPAQPGIYRFFGEQRRLLYIGKSRDLRRRVASYFRPLAADHKRRALLLSELRDLEWETTPSELEALILESAAIRLEAPLHNQQTELHASAETVSPQDSDLAFILWEGDPEEVSAFLLRDGKAWARARLPRDPDRCRPADVQSLVDAWMTGRMDPGIGLHPISEQEGLLVLRYLRLFGDRVDRIRMADFSTPEEIGQALADLATRKRPHAEPWFVRSPTAGKS